MRVGPAIRGQKQTRKVKKRFQEDPKSYNSSLTNF